MSEEDIRVNRLRLGQQNADFSEVEETEEKDETSAEIRLFGDNNSTLDGLRDVSEGLFVHERGKALYDAVQRGFAGITSYGDLERNFNFDAAIGQVQYTRYHFMLDSLIAKSHELSDEELENIFQEISGMSTEEYLQKSSDKDFQMYMQRIGGTVRKSDILFYYLQQITYGKETMETTIDSAIAKKENDLKSTTKAYKDVLDNEGFVSWCMNGLIYACGGTTRSDVEGAIQVDAIKIEQLKKYAQERDIGGFMGQYRNITGVSFDIGNFVELAKVEREYQVFSFAERFNTARNKLAKEEAPTYVSAMGAGIGTGTFYEQTNYNLGSLYPNGVIRSSNDRNSPLENALMEVYGDKEAAYNWIQANIKRLGLEDKSPKEKYKTLVKEFYACSDVVNNGLKEQFGNTSFKQVEEKYKQCLKEAYGISFSQEALDNYVSNQATAKGALNMAILIGAGMFAGPAALTTIVGTLSTIEKATDANSLTGGELVEIGGQMALMYAGFKVFEFAAHATSGPLENYLLKQGVSKKAAGIMSREASSALGGFSAGMSTGTVSGLIEGKDLIEAAKQGFTSAFEGAAFALTFGAILEAVSALKAARATKAQIKMAEDKLATALAQEKDSALQNLSERLKQEGLSKDMLSQIKKQAARVHHPDRGGSQEAMSAYNSLVKELGDLIDGIPSLQKRTTQSKNASTKAENIPKTGSSTAIVPNAPDTAEMPLLAYTPSTQGKSPLDSTMAITTATSAGFHYPALTLLDELTHMDFTPENTFYTKSLDKKAGSKKIQAEVGEYLDAILSAVPQAQRGNGNSLKPFDDYILPNGTIIARNPHGNERPILDENGWPVATDFSTDEQIVLWVKDTNGNQHVLPCLSKANAAKAKEVCDYLATLQSIPRDQIDAAQSAKLREIQEDATIQTFEETLELEYNEGRNFYRKKSQTSTKEAKASSKKASSKKTTRAKKTQSAPVKKETAKQNVDLSNKIAVEAEIKKYIPNISKQFLSEILNLPQANLQNIFKRDLLSQYQDNSIALLSFAALSDEQYALVKQISKEHPDHPTLSIEKYVAPILLSNAPDKLLALCEQYTYLDYDLRSFLSRSSERMIDVAQSHLDKGYKLGSWDNRLYIQDELFPQDTVVITETQNNISYGYVTQSGERRIAIELIETKDGTYMKQASGNIYDEPEIFEKEIEKNIIKLDNPPRLSDYKSVKNFFDTWDFKGTPVREIKDYDGGIRISDFVFPQGANTGVRANVSVVAQMDNAAKPSKNSERIVMHYDDGRTTVNDWGLGISSTMVKTENGMSIIKHVGEKTLRLSSEIKDNMIKITNNETGNVLTFPLSEIVEAGELSGETKNIELISMEQRAEKIETLFKKLSPITLLNIINFKIQNPTAQFPYLASNEDAFTSNKLKVLTLSDSPDVVAHETAHSMFSEDMQAKVLDIYTQEQQQVSGILAREVEHTDPASRNGFLSAGADKVVQEGAKKALGDVVAISTTMNEYGTERPQRAEGVRLAYPQTIKASEDMLMDANIELVQKLVVQRPQSQEDITLSKLPDVSKTITDIQAQEWEIKHSPKAIVASRKKSLDKAVKALQQAPLLKGGKPSAKVAKILAGIKKSQRLLSGVKLSKKALLKNLNPIAVNPKKVAQALSPVTNPNTVLPMTSSEEAIEAIKKEIKDLVRAQISMQNPEKLPDAKDVLSPYSFSWNDPDYVSLADDIDTLKLQKICAKAAYNSEFSVSKTMNIVPSDTKVSKILVDFFEENPQLPDWSILYLTRKYRFMDDNPELLKVNLKLAAKYVSQVPTPKVVQATGYLEEKHFDEPKLPKLNEYRSYTPKDYRMFDNLSDDITTAFIMVELAGEGRSEYNLTDKQIAKLADIIRGKDLGNDIDFGSDSVGTLIRNLKRPMNTHGDAAIDLYKFYCRGGIITDYNIFYNIESEIAVDTELEVVDILDKLNQKPNLKRIPPKTLAILEEKMSQIKSELADSDKFILTYDSLERHGLLDILHGKNGYFIIPNGLLSDIGMMSEGAVKLFKQLILETDFDAYEAYKRVCRADSKGLITTQKTPDFYEKIIRELIFIPGRGQQLSIHELFDAQGLISPSILKKIKERNLLALPEYEAAGRHISIKDAVALADFSDAEFEKLREFFHIEGRSEENQFKPLELKKAFGKLSDEQLQIAKEFVYIPELGNEQLSPSTISKLIQLPAEGRQRIIDDLLPLAKTDKTIKSIIKLLFRKPLKKPDEVITPQQSSIDAIAELSAEEFSALTKHITNKEPVMWHRMTDADTFRTAFKLLELRDKYPDLEIFSTKAITALTLDSKYAQRAIKLVENLDPKEYPIMQKYSNRLVTFEGDIDTVIKLLKIKTTEGSPFIESYYDIEHYMEKPEQISRLNTIIESCEAVPPAYFVSSVVSEENAFKEFLALRDTIVDDGKPLGGDISLIILQYNQRAKTIKDNPPPMQFEIDTTPLSPDHPDIKLLLNATAKNGTKLFTRQNIATMLKQYSPTDRQFMNLPELMISQLQNIENRQTIDFACRNSELIFAFGLDVIKNLSRYEFMNDETKLKEFLNAQGEAVSMKNKQIFSSVMNTPDSAAVQQVIAQFKRLLNESIDFNLFDKINSMPIKDSMKFKLATNNTSISIKGLERAAKYLKSLDKAKLAKCSDEVVDEMITLTAIDITSQDVSDNLLLLGRVSDLQEKFTEVEASLFGDKLEVITAKVAKALNQVITPANVETKDMTPFFRGFILDADAVNGQAPDSILSGGTFGEFLHNNGKRGIGLEISRKDFVTRLNEILGRLDEQTSSEIVEKIGIDFPIKIAKVSQMPEIIPPESTFVPKTYSAEETKTFEKEHLSDKPTEPVTLIMNGERLNLTKYNDTQGGSNEGYIAKAENGELYYIKFPSSQDAASQELLASMLYREAGILAPEITLICTPEGKIGIASKIIPNTRNLDPKGEAEVFQQGFAVDAWLANWDIFQNNNAVFSAADNTCARMDVGGSLEYRARGAKKLTNEFDSKVTALSSLISSNPNNPFAIVNAATLRSSIERVLRISDEQIAILTAEAGCPKTLAYTLIARKRYLANIYNSLQEVSPEQLVTPEMLDNMAKTISYDNGTAFNGILTDVKLNTNNPVEKQVYDLVHKFVYENELQVDNPEIKELLNQLVHAFPEYMSIIGKSQHHTHAYSLDGHILTVLNKAMNAPEYAQLSKQDKIVLKLAILFHDMSKAENVIDHSHPKISSMYARDMLKRVHLPVAMKERIVEMIENHHWFKRANSNPSDTDMKELAARFRRNNDLIIAKIFAEADLSSIRPGFEIGKIENLPETYQKLQALQKEMHSRGSFTYTTPFFCKILGDKANVSYIRNGHTYNIPVLNFSANAAGKENTGVIITEHTDLREFGFIQGGGPVSRNDLSLLVHCTENPMDVYYLGDISSNADICTSNITLDKMKFYYGAKNPCGVVLETLEQANVGSSLDKNQGSGGHKNFVNFASEIWAYSRKDGHLSEKKENAAIFRKLTFCEYMEKIGIPLTDEEYAQIHQTFFDRMFLSQIHDVRLQNGRVIKEADLKAAIKHTDDQIRAKAKATHNETNVYAPKVRALFSTEDSLDAVPTKILQAAEELGVPIFLLGKYKKYNTF